MAKESRSIVSEARQSGTVERRHGDLVDQVAEERGLGEDLDIEELGDRLQRDRHQFLESMEPTGGMGIEHRNGEDRLPEEPRQPASPLREV